MWERKYRNTVSSSPVHRKLYGIRRKMIERCTDPSSERYKDYGGRGIKICDEWLYSYDAFVDWAKENGYKEGLSIDRINNDGNYEPANCRWITKREQNRNKRTNVMVTYRGETKPLVVWCEELGLKYDPIHNRITQGWDVESAFNTPLASEHESFASMCRRHGINQTTAWDRIVKFGWTLEDALNTPAGEMGAHRKKTYGTAVCKVCGKAFTKNTSRQVYCCEKCHCDSKRVWFKRKQGVMTGSFS